jgi:hypothetical protein
MVGNPNSLNPLSLPPKQIKAQTKKITIKSFKKKTKNGERNSKISLSPPLHKTERAQN